MQFSQSDAGNKGPKEVDANWSLAIEAGSASHLGAAIFLQAAFQQPRVFLCGLGVRIDGDA